SFLFYCTQPATTWFYTLSLHDALPIYGPWRIDDLYRGQVEKREELVDHAVFFQKSLPGHSPEQKVHPHRQDKEQHHKAGLAYFHIRKHHSQGIGQQKTDQGAYKGQEKRKAESLKIFHSPDSQDI